MSISDLMDHIIWELPWVFHNYVLTKTGRHLVKMRDGSFRWMWQYEYWETDWVAAKVL